jgi:pimeloyl-ACP methyl ester carboxylesterase
MRTIAVPCLVMAGDEDDPCLEASLFMKRTIARSALAILPRTGHALNLEEPALFNALVDDFFHQVESGRFGERDPRSKTSKIL